MLFGILAGLLTFWLTAYALGLLALTRRRPADPVQAAATAAGALLRPALLALMMGAAILLPLIVESLGNHFSHGHAHRADILHHVPGVSPYWAWPMMGLLTLFLLRAWLPPLWTNLRLRLWLGQLRRSGAAHRPGQDDLAHLETRYQGKVLLVPGAWTGLAGVFRPVLLLGRDLVARLTPSELEGLIAHEEVHRRRRDPLMRFVLLVLSRLLPLVGPRLLSRWQVSSELHCDRHAGRRIADPLSVASALLNAHRLQCDSWANTALVGFHCGGTLERRVNTLLDMEANPNSRAELPPAPSLLPLFLWIGAALALAHPAHYLFELLLATVI